MQENAPTKSGFDLVLAAEPSEFAVAYTISNINQTRGKIKQLRPPVRISTATTSGNSTVTMSDTTGLVKGMTALGSGIPVNANIISIVANTSVTLSQKATASATIDAVYAFTYFNFSEGQGERVDQFGDYIFTQNQQARAGELTYVFGPYKNDTDALVPIYDHYTEEDMGWPSVMSNYLQHTHNTGTASPSSQHQAIWLNHEYKGMTQYRIRQYFNAVPFPQSQFVTASMAPTAFSFNYLVDADSVGECLHNGISLEGIQFIGGPNDGVNILPVGIVATNFIQWADHFIHISQTRRVGGYFMETVEAKNPKTSLTVNAIPNWS